MRNVVERAFGVLKEDSYIISSVIEPTYGVKTQNFIIITCCILHNSLIMVDLDEDLVPEVDEEINSQIAPQQHVRDLVE